jgi:hypothetical protein
LRNLVAEILKDLLYPFKSVRHVLPQALVDPDNRVRFELIGLERVRIALVRGFDIPRGPSAKTLWTGLRSRKNGGKRRQRVLLETNDGGPLSANNPGGLAPGIIIFPLQ